MLMRLRPRLTYANVVSSIALFVVLGGGAYATIDRKIGTKDIKRNAVTTKKINKQAVRAGKMAPNSVRAGKIFDGAVLTDKLADGAVTEGKLADGVAISGPQGETGPQGPPGPSTGPAGGDLTGSYPNPLIADGAVGTENIALGANGVAQAAVNVNGADGTVRAFFNRFGGAPTVNRVAAGRYVITIPGFPGLPGPVEAANAIHLAVPSRIDGDRNATVFASGSNPAVRTVDPAGDPADANFIYVLYGAFGP
jgi:hypothetical protein